MFMKQERKESYNPCHLLVIPVGFRKIRFGEIGAIDNQGNFLGGRATTLSLTHFVGLIAGRVPGPVTPLLLVVPLEVTRALFNGRTAAHAVGVDFALDEGSAVLGVRVETVLGAHALGLDDVLLGAGEGEGQRGVGENGEDIKGAHFELVDCVDNNERRRIEGVNEEESFGIGLIDYRRVWGSTPFLRLGSGMIMMAVSACGYGLIAFPKRATKSC